MRRAALLAAILATQPGCLVRWLMLPTEPFADQAPPVAPDYADPAAWSARPDREDSADVVPEGFSAASPALADVFYLHPTSYISKHWNGPVDDPELNAVTDRVATGVQAPAFNGCCAIWAPRYRQANGTAFFAPTEDGDRALELAYGDVSRAFDAFLGAAGERPFVLAAHSQGSVLAERLLIERIAGTALEDRLVVAVLLGGRVTRGTLAAHGLRACEAPDDVGCVVAWNARSPSYEPDRLELHVDDPEDRVCTNPLTWLPNGARAPATQNTGAVFLESDPRPMPGFADARCVDGTLEVSEIGRAPRSLASKILDALVGRGNYHPIEVQMYFLDLRQNVERRVRAHLAQRPTP